MLHSIIVGLLWLYGAALALLVFSIWFGLIGFLLSDWSKK